MSKKKIAVGYVRVSTDQQAEKGSSLENQVARIKDFCEQKGLVLENIYQDAGFSGKNTNRPAFKAMMKYIYENKVDSLIVWHSNRFARNLRDYVVHLYELEKRHVTFHSIEEPEFSGSSGKAMRNLLAVFAEYQSDLTGEQVRSVKSNLKKNKQVYCGYAPLGFSHDEGKLISDENQSIIVKRIFKMKNQGYSMNKISKVLNEEGIKGSKGGKFYRSTIQKILNNNIYDNETRGAAVQ